MRVELEQKEIALLVTELESGVQELRALIASGMKKDLRDDIRKDKVMLMDILTKVKNAAIVKKHDAAA